MFWWEPRLIVGAQQTADREPFSTPPPPIPGIQQVEFVKILGVTIGRTFSMQDHVF